MTPALNLLLNSFSAVLIIFTSAAAVASGFTSSTRMRAAAGMAAVLLALVIPISTRSIFEWTVSAVERLSLPGLTLLVAIAVSAVTGWRIAAVAEFRFATTVLAIAGIALYPAAMGFLDYDVYVLGYSGYLLPVAVALVIGYAIFRGYLLTTVVLNVAVAAFLLGAGESRNLWDYVLDPIAWIIGSVTWLIIGASHFRARHSAGKVQASPQPSSGMGETPISH